MSYPEIDERIEKYLNDYTFIAAYKALDGTIFYGDQDGAIDKFKEHNKKIIEKLESEMCGNVSIYKADYFFNGYKNAYVKFHTPVGKTQFKLWCKYNKITLKNESDINGVLELEKWYGVSMSGNIFQLQTTDIEEYLTLFNELKYKLDNVNNNEVFV